MLLTPTEVTIFSNITASVGTIIAEQLIEEVQERIVMKTNNYFLLDLYLQEGMTFYASNRTIVSTNSFEDENFVAGDDIYIYNSYRNDGYKTLASVSDNVLTLTSAYSVVDELSGQSIMISVVQWPLEVKKIAARMIAYDYDVRESRKGLKVRSLGPLYESYYEGENYDPDGYPREITNPLDKYTVARFK